MSAIMPVGDQDHQTQPVVGEHKQFRIAIVGCGPRGLHCLLELSEQLRQINTDRPAAVTVFEPCEFPGAGNVYHPRQPTFLRMNFAAKYINAWRPTDAETDRERCLIGWLRRHDPHVNADDFISRAVVGTYLHDCFLKVLATIKQRAAVTIVRKSVTSIERAGQAGPSWRVAAERQSFVFDEVVVTVGHEGWRQCENVRDSGAPAMVPTFPVDRWLNPKMISAGSTVAVRGFGLTWIDAALTLTEGRGGDFTNDGDRWRYHRSGREPQRLLPFSRSGRPMLSKPDESCFVQPRELEEVWKDGREAITAVSRPVDGRKWTDCIWRAIITAAARAANHFISSATPGSTARSVERWFQHWSYGSMLPTTSLAFMRRSWQIATGQADPDVAWALGAAWRNLYPGLVGCVSYGGLAADAWPEFRRILVEMERIAFGPPAQNLGRILALIDAGIVDLRFLRGSGTSTSHSARPGGVLVNKAETAAVDHFVDAVIPSPLQVCSGGPIRKLLKTGWVQRLHGIEGIRVDEAGRPIDDAGCAVPGLAILGRVTEGCVLGNDSLSRTLHDQPRRWAVTAIRPIKCLEPSQ